MATDEWYCELENGIVGPILPSEVLRRIRLGEIVFSTPVRKNNSQWVPAWEVNGLFESAAKDKAVFRCPFCGNGVERPPSMCSQCSQKIERVTATIKFKATEADKKAPRSLPPAKPTDKTASPQPKMLGKAAGKPPPAPYIEPPAQPEKPERSGWGRFWRKK